MYNSYSQNDDNNRMNGFGNGQNHNGYGFEQSDTPYGAQQIRYSYGNNGGYNWSDSAEAALQKKKDKKNLRKLSLYAGGAFLCYILMQNLFVVILDAVGFMDIYNRNNLVQTATDILFSVSGILLPFLFFGRKMKKLSGNGNCYNFSAPFNLKDSLLAIVAGVGLCMLANVVTSYFTVFVGLFGVELSSPDISMPTGALGVFINILRTVVVAAFVEEVCLRGSVMGNLRQYGDRFAIFASAFVFGLMHGNLIQIPFAFIAGFGLGYLSIKCGSLWIAVAIHMVNNGLSILISYLVDIVPESAALALQALMIYGLSIVGVFCFVAFSKRNAHRQLRQNSTLLSMGQMTVSYLTTPTMIVSILLMVYITSSFVQFGG